MRYLITFSYDGSKFHGFQRQKDVKNVQGTLERALSQVLGEDIVIKGSGRTDASVHALGQCAHFDVSRRLSYKDRKKVNELCNGEINIYKWQCVNDGFHARFSVKKKVYVYKINNGKFNIEKADYYWFMPKKLDISKMRKVASILEGTHDYHNFVSGERDDYVSTIFKIRIKKRCDIITITFVGKGFYRYMVRHLVGAIVDVGKGKASIQEVKEMLDNPLVERNLCVVPPEGLYLKRIFY